MEQESKDNLSSFVVVGGKIATTTNGGSSGSSSSLISKRVTSAGALVRQQTTPPLSIVHQKPSPIPKVSLSEANLAILESIEKMRLANISISDQPSIVKESIIDQQSISQKSIKVDDIDFVKIQKQQESSSGSESTRQILNTNDYQELKIRYASMESAYEVDRQKTTLLLSKKDAHISRLQERLNSLEHRLELASQRQSETDPTHGLIAERDSLLDKVKRLEQAFALEKSVWETRASNLERELRLATSASASTTGAAASDHQCVNNRRGDFERLEKENEQLQQENQRKETVLSELSAEATELRVQLNSYHEERTNLKRRLVHLEDEHRRRLKKSSTPVATSVDETLFLRKKLNEAQNYFEAMDIESEQQITDLTNQLEDLHSQLEQKQRDIQLFNNRLQELEHERDTALAKIKTNDSNFTRQQDVIEGLRDDLDRQRDKYRETGKDRDDLLLRNAGLSHELELVKREASKQRDEIHSHLNDVSRQLEQCQSKLRERNETVAYDSNTAAKLSTLTRKVGDLETALVDRDTTILKQQQRLADMKRALQKEWKSELDNNQQSISQSMAFGLDFDHGNSNSHQFGLSRSTQSISVLADDRLLAHFQYLKNVILRFVTSSDYEATQLVRAVAALLCLTPEEEQLVWDTLKWKMSWVPASKPKLPLTQ